MRTSRRLLLSAAVAASLLGAAACSTSDATQSSGGAGAPAGASAPAAGVPAATAAKQQGRTVIDVRTPEEFAAGHVDGARNLNLQGATFAADVQALDPAGRYVVYCRSGNRSATAAGQMRQQGLDVVDGGGLDDMRQAGWPVSA